MIEVELLDDGTGPREFSKELLEVSNLQNKVYYLRVFISRWFLSKKVREMIINQKNGSKYMMTKYHMDGMVSKRLYNPLHMLRSTLNRNSHTTHKL